MTGSFSAATVAAALVLGLWEQMQGLQWPPEPLTSSLSLSGRHTGVPSTHCLLPDLAWDVRAGFDWAAVPEWKQRMEELYPEWEQGTEGSPSCQQPCSPLLPGGGAAKGISQLRVTTGGCFQTRPGKGATRKAVDKAGDVHRTTRGSQQ